MNRFVTRIKKGTKSGITAVILGNESNYRTKSYGPKCLLSYKNSTVMQHQINALESIDAGFEKIIVLGFECNKVIKHIPNNIRIVENQLFGHTNSAESLRLVVNNICNQRLLIMDGNLLMKRELLKDFNFSDSFSVCYPIDTPNGEIGASNVNNQITNFSFGLDYCWSHVSFIQHKEFELFREVCSDKERSKFFVFELLNIMLDMGGKMRMHMAQPDDIIKVNSIRDLI